MIDFLLKFLQSPKEKSTITSYTNLLGKFDEKTLLTKNDNLVIAFKIDGIDYTGMSKEKETTLHADRYNFFTRLKESVQCNVFIRKKKIIKEENTFILEDDFNKEAKKIIDKWEKDFKVTKIEYLFFVSTKNFGLVDKIDKKIQERDIDTKLQDIESKKAFIEKIALEINNFFKAYTIERLNADEILSFYASLLNAEEMKIDCDKYFFDDYFSNANIEFKKNYFIRELPNKSVYSAILSIATYESDEITRKNITDFLKIDTDLYINISFMPLNQRLGRRALLEARTRTKDPEISNNLLQLLENYDTDKANILELAINILIEESSIERLNFVVDQIINTAKMNNLIMKRETLSQDVIFISFFPSNFDLNTRRRTQTSAVLTTYLSFENDPRGSNRNPWGNAPVAIFKNSINKPYLFNFHLPLEDNESSTRLKAGHTLVIGSTDSGKTTLMSFLMLGLLKYKNLNIFALDKFKGMKIFTDFIGGEYNDIGENFSLNPFSLSNNERNLNFLENWLKQLAGIESANDPDDIEKISIIKKTLDRIFTYATDESHKNLKSFLLSLEDDPVLKTKLELFKNSIFDNEIDTLNFKKRLSILNMDSVLKDQELTSYIAYYIFHKIIAISEEQERGFFIFIDELREYLGNPSMAHQILTMILEARKLNGVIAMGVQNINFFEEMVGEKTAQIFLDNIAHFIIYPTATPENLENLQKKLDLTTEEMEFLRSTPVSDRKVLIKQGSPSSKQIKTSVIVDLNLAPLEEYLKIFSSSKTDIAMMEKLKKDFPEEWREKYLSN